MIPFRFISCAVLALLAGRLDALELREDCVTPNSSQGTCIGVRDCSPLLDLVQEKPLSQANLEFLRKSQCGFHDRQPLVCCPKQNSAPISPAAETVEELSGHRNLPLLRNDICGPINSDILIGQLKGFVDEFLWMALIAYSGGEGNGTTFKCSGTVINDFYILTAAHCLYSLRSGSRPVFVRLGEHDLNSSIDCEEYDFDDAKICNPEPQDIPIAQVVVHPQYTGKPDFHNDIALIRLAKPINFSSDSVQPVCLPIGLTPKEQNLDGKRLIVMGWDARVNGSASGVLLKVSVPVKSNAECRSEYRNLLQISETSQLCAGGERDGVITCNWDSGGPLTHFGPINGSMRTIQHGIVSFRPPACDTSGLPAVYTLVGYYMNWILDNISS